MKPSIRFPVTKGLMMEVNEQEDIRALSVETSIGPTVSLLGGIMLANHKSEITVVSHLNDASGSFRSTLKVERIASPIEKKKITNQVENPIERQKNGKANKKED